MTKEKAATKDKNAKAANTSLWRKVFETDPAHTKFVKVGRGFTTIDAFYQVQRATEVFGPIGIGWGWTADESIDDGLIIVKIGLWYVHPDTAVRSEPIVHFGCRALRSSKGRINEEAAKQAATDAMTKALSYIGFSGDVFMGKFDDNKYVAQQSAKFEAEAAAPSQEQETVYIDLVAHLGTVTSAEELAGMRPRLSEAKDFLPRGMIRELMDLYIKRSKDFKEGETE